INLGPIAGRQDYAASGVLRQSFKVFLKRLGGNCNALENFDWSALDIQTCEDEIQIIQTYRGRFRRQ
ncbi:MAG: hypothetical protein O3B95_12545, partial [Chloroflexi bacterium]|nr:hypothetical protein [Chloroflexota bacterium]